MLKVCIQFCIEGNKQVAMEAVKALIPQFNDKRVDINEGEGFSILINYDSMVLLNFQHNCSAKAKVPS